MLSERKHKAKAVNWTLGKTSTGKEQIAVQFEVTDGEEGGETITWYGYFSDAAIDRTVESLRYCGWEGDDLTQLDTLGKNEVELDVKHEEYNGVWRAKVAFVNKLGGGPAVKEQLSDVETKTFAARMKSRIASVGAREKTAALAPPAKAGKPAPRKPLMAPAPQAATADDDVGF